MQDSEPQNPAYSKRMDRLGQAGMAALYGLALFFLFIRVVGMGTLTAISHHAISKNAVAAWVVLAASWLFMLVLVVKAVLFWTRHQRA